MSQPDTDAEARQNGSSKRSRKSAYPKRILQHQQQLMEAKVAAGSCPKINASQRREDGEKRPRRDPSPNSAPQPPSPPPHPTAPPLPPLPIFPPQSLPTKDDGGAELLRSLATLNPQSLIPTLYAALGGGGSGGGGNIFGLGGVGHIGGISNGAAEAARPRGRPKGIVEAAGTAPFSQRQSPPQPLPQPQHQLQQRRGPRPFDPQATPEPVRIITRKGVAYNRRPRSFYSPEIKLAVIEFAEQHGASAAERHFKVPLSTVQSWMRHDNKARILRAPPSLSSTTAQLPPPPPQQQQQQQLPPLPLNLSCPQFGRIPLPSNRHRDQC